MANMREVNKAIKQRFPDLEIEAVRGDGYVYFVHSDKYDQLPSIYAHPPSTPTNEMIRLCVEQIEDLKAVETAEEKTLPAGYYTAKIVEGDKMVIVGGAHSGTTIKYGILNDPRVTCVQTHRQADNLPKRSYQQQAIDRAKQVLKRGLYDFMSLESITKHLGLTGAPNRTALMKWSKPKKNKGPLKRKDWMGRGGDRHAYKR